MKAAALAAMLARRSMWQRPDGTHGGLISLDLSKNQIRDEGAVALAVVLKQGACGKLQTLNLSNNQIGDEGAAAVAAEAAFRPAPHIWLLTPGRALRRAQLSRTDQSLPLIAQRPSSPWRW